MELNNKISDIHYPPNNTFYAVECRPELDTKDECTEYQVNLIQSLIGVLRCILELDII